MCEEAPLSRIQSFSRTELVEAAAIKAQLQLHGLEVKEFLQEVFPLADALKCASLTDLRSCLSVFFVFLMMIGVSPPVRIVAVDGGVFIAWAETFVCWSVEAFGGDMNVVVRNRGEESKNQLVECRAQAV